LDISASAIHTILRNHLQVRKVCSFWVPHALTDELMAQHVSWCHKMLSKFENGMSHYVSSILTGDETRLYFYGMPTKAQNKVWIFENENKPVSV
jgi:hypothetical protein